MDPILELKQTLQQVKDQLEKTQNNSVAHKEAYEKVCKDLAAVTAKLAELEERISKRKIPGLADENKRSPFSLFKAIYAIGTGDWKQAGFEREVMQLAQQKAMEAGTGSAGGYIVPPEVMTELIEQLKAELVVKQAGATIMDGLVGSPVEIPKQTAAATAYWVGENSAITASQLTLGQVTMTPNDCAALVKLSNRLLKLSNPSAEALIRSDIVSQIELAIDLAALRGAGGAEPLGIANTPSINTYAIGADGGDATREVLLEMEGKLEDSNALRGNLAYIMHGKVVRKLKKERIAQYSGQTAGAYVILPMSDEQLKNTIGYPFLKTSQIPTNLTKGSGTALSEVYFGNWKELLIGMWGGMELATSNVAGDNNGGAFSSNQTWIRAIMSVDVALRHPESFCLVNDAKTV